MKESYKNYINQIHAPAELIEATIKKVNEEKSSKKVKKKSFYPYLAAGAAAAMVTIAVGFNSVMNSAVYTPVSESMVRINNKTDQYRSMSLEDYEKYIGMDLQELFDEEELEKTSINVIMDKDGLKPAYDEAVLNFSVEGNLFIMKLSKTDNLLPKELIDSPESKVGSYEIHLGTDESGKRLYAGGNFKGVNYFIMGNKINKKEFQKKIEKYLNKMKPFES